MSKASWRWASSPCARATQLPLSRAISLASGGGSSALPAGPPWPLVESSRERPREQEVADGDRPLAAGVGDDRRQPAAERGIVEDVVVDERRHVDELDRGRGADRLLPGAASGTEEDEQRPHPLAAGRQRLAGVGAELRPPTVDRLAEPALDLGHPRRQPCRGESVTAVTGGGTADGRVTTWALGGAVDGDDAPARTAQRISRRSRRDPSSPRAVGRGKASHRLRQVAVGVVVGRNRAEHRHDLVEPERVEARQRRPGRRRYLEDDEPAPRLSTRAISAGPCRGRRGCGGRSRSSGRRSSRLCREARARRPTERHGPGGAVGRLAACDAEHLLEELSRSAPPPAAELRRPAQGEIAGAAGYVEGAVSGPEPGQLGGALAPLVVKPRGHRRVQQVVAAGDAVEHAAHLLGELVGPAVRRHVPGLRIGLGRGQRRDRARRPSTSGYALSSARRGSPRDR